MVSKEEEMLKERIRHLLTMKRVSVASLADNETLRIRYRRQINGDAAVPYSTIHLLLTMFHDISADWLVMGEGSMRKADCLAPKVYNHNQVTNSTAGGDMWQRGCTMPKPWVCRFLNRTDCRRGQRRKCCDG